ncbi:unnamed protein product, partial [Adineta steineri]
SALCFIAFVGCGVAAYLRWDIYKNEIGLFFAYNIPSFFNGFVGFCFMFTLIPFWCYHCRLTMNGETTRDDIRYKKHLEKNELPRGSRCHNLIASWCGPTRPSVNWNELYDADHYTNQEAIYRRIRPTLLSNTLIILTQRIREHIQDLVANNYHGLQQQVEAYHRTNKKTLETQSELSSVTVMSHLQTYTIEINCIGNNQIDVRYLLIDAVQQINISAFWNTIWLHRISSIVMLYEIHENNSLIQYWPDENNPTITIENTYQIDFIRHFKRLDIETLQFKIQKLGETETRTIEHFQVKNWTEIKFALDPVALLRLQYYINDKERNERLLDNTPNSIAIHSCGVNIPAVAYMTIDINRRLSMRYSFINILKTITELNTQLPMSIMNKDLLIVVYTVILHLSAWIYSSDTMTLQGINHQVTRILQTKFGTYFHDSILELFEAFTSNSLKELNAILPLSTEYSNRFAIVDHHVLYFIDSYIHSKPFMLTVGHDSSTTIKIISKFQIRHCFLFQHSSHLDIGFIEKQRLKIDNNDICDDFRRYHNDESTTLFYQPINSIRNILLYRVSQILVNLDQNDDVPILIWLNDIREGAIICLLANLMEQFNTDHSIDIYHQARKIAFMCSAFRTEDEFRNMYEWIKKWTENELQNQTN